LTCFVWGADQVGDASPALLWQTPQPPVLALVQVTATFAAPPRPSVWQLFVEQVPLVYLKPFASVLEVPPAVYCPDVSFVPPILAALLAPAGPVACWFVGWQLEHA
jgi:hypothetical protein